MPLFDSFKDENFDWVSVLLLLIGSSVVSVMAPNFMNRNPRTHNLLRLINECTARVQLAYISFYLTLLIVGKFSTTLGRFIGFIMFVGLGFWLGGLYLASKQDRTIQRFHGLCNPGTDGECDTKFRRYDRWRVIQTNAVISVLSCILALGFAFSSTVVKKEPPSVQPSPPSIQSISPSQNPHKN